MNAYENDLLDQSKVVHLGDRREGGPTVAMTPPDAPGVVLSEGSRGYPDVSRSRFNWKPTIAITAVVVLLLLSLAFL